MFPHQFKRLTELLRTELGAINKTVQKQECAIRDATEEKRHEWREMPRVIAANVLGTAEEKESSKAHKIKAEGQQDLLVKSQNRLVSWTRLAFLAAAVYAGIATWQGCLMHRTYTEIHDQTRAAQESAYAACINAQIARNSLLQFEQTQSDAHAATIATVKQGFIAAESERALIEIKLGIPRFEKGIAVPVLIYNIGKSEARQFKLRIVAAFLARDKDPVPFSYAHGGEIAVGRLAPGLLRIVADPNKEFFEPVLNSDGSPYLSSDTDQEDFIGGRKDAVVYAKFSYTDIFGQHRGGTFCTVVQNFPNGPVKEIGHQKCQKYGHVDMSLLRDIPKPAKPFIQPIPEVSCPAPPKL